jgi:hypothetical protein
MAIPLCPLPASGARARAAAAGAAGLRDDNLGKRTIAAARDRATARKVARKKNAGGPGPPAAQVPPCSRRYWRRARCHPRSITIAATLRQTAAPHASVNNEIHMATLSDFSSHVCRAGIQLRSRQSVPGTCGKIPPFWVKRSPRAWLYCNRCLIQGRANDPKLIRGCDFDLAWSMRNYSAAVLNPSSVLWAAPPGLMTCHTLRQT